MTDIIRNSLLVFCVCFLVAIPLGIDCGYGYAIRKFEREQQSFSERVREPGDVADRIVSDNLDKRMEILQQRLNTLKEKQ